MILKNCHIYDELADQEKNVDIFFNESIIEFRENLFSEFNLKPGTKELKLSELTKENIN